MAEFKKSKIEICCSVRKGTLSEQIKMLDDLYSFVDSLFNEWEIAGLKLNPTESVTVKETSKTDKGPALNLERLSLPNFRGNVREFAKFMKEFENTVGLQFTDPKIKVLYLKNQCLN